MRLKPSFAALFAAVLLGGCLSPQGSMVPSAAGAGVDAGVAPFAGGSSSVLKLLVKQQVIGSTVDPVNGDRHPAGLAIAKYKYQAVQDGYIYVCNFADTHGTAGAGTTVVSLAPVGGSKPQRYAQSASLQGCANPAFDIGDHLWVAASSAKTETELTAKGKVGKLETSPYVLPLGTAFGTDVAGSSSFYATTAIFASDASTGSIVLAEYCAPSSPCTYPRTPVISGFAVRKGGPGSARGPIGLAFDPGATASTSSGTLRGALFVVDGANNTIVEVYNATLLSKANSIVVKPGGKTFSGPDASWAKVFFAGAPLNGPLGATIVHATSNTTLPANVVVANTRDAAGRNLLLEFSPSGKVLDRVNVDKGKGGALFGLQAVGAGAGTQVYFTDANANNVQVLEK